VIVVGATRILTSGGTATAEQGAAKLTELVTRAGKRITILAGGGIHPENLEKIMYGAGASEFHSGLSSVLPYPRRDHAQFEAGVREMAGILKRERADG
jgi:copper homeostasis protein